VSKRKRPVFLTAEEAAELIADGNSLAILGAGGGPGEPTSILEALAERYEEEGSPKGLTLIHSSGLGDKERIGTDLLVKSGLVDEDIAGHLGMAPAMAAKIRQNEIAGYNLPQGVMAQLYRAIAAAQPGVFTKVGLNTFIDPRLEGGRLNERAKRELVKLMEIEGEQWLFYPRMHIDVALVRGTTADMKGNISSEQEAAIYEGISIAQAAKACGGIVIAQVKRVAKTGTLDPRQVVIPGVSVDYVVVDPEQKQTCLSSYDPSLSGEIRVPDEHLPVLPLNARKVIACRAAEELYEGASVNVGVGIPDGIPAVAAEQGRLHDLTFTLEQGLVGGMPAAGVIFGVSHNPEARIHQSHQFDYYDGGGLDLAFLGMAETDEDGNVNVSKVGNAIFGCGGFINISQNARKVVFCGTFTAKGVELEIGNGQLKVLKEGEFSKFVDKVHQVTYSGQYARKVSQPVLYVTERAVFKLEKDGLVLIEIAPGIDLERDVLKHMGFKPAVSSDLKLMDPAYFTE